MNKENMEYIYLLLLLLLLFNLKEKGNSGTYYNMNEP
jgi:hypothetical protein